jgi:hypothetical protein
MFANGLVASLERDELLRALGCVVDGLISEANEVKELATKVEPQLRDLPLQAGEKVEVIIIVQSSPAHSQHAYPLRGTPVAYIDPTEPVAESDWEAAA